MRITEQLAITALRCVIYEMLLVSFGLKWQRKLVGNELTDTIIMF